MPERAGIAHPLQPVLEIVDGTGGVDGKDQREIDTDIAGRFLGKRRHDARSNTHKHRAQTQRHPRPHRPHPARLSRRHGRIEAGEPAKRCQDPAPFPGVQAFRSDFQIPRHTPDTVDPPSDWPTTGPILASTCTAAVGRSLCAPLSVVEAMWTQAPALRRVPLNADGKEATLDG